MAMTKNIKNVNNSIIPYYALNYISNSLTKNEMHLLFVNKTQSANKIKIMNRKARPKQTPSA